MNPIRLESRRLVELTGADAAAFLHGLVSQSATALLEGAAAFGALLTPQGKIRADFIFQRTAAGFLLDVHAQIVDAFIRMLSAYKLRADVAVALRPELVVVAGDGDAPFGAFADPRLARLGWRLATAAPPPAASNEQLYVRTRRGLGVPEIGADFAADSVFLTDVNYDALHGVDYRKGCFVGQEVTSRMKRRGELRKRTLIMRFDGAPPPRGAMLDAGGVDIGETLDAEGGVGLALVRLDRLAEAERLGAPITAPMTAPGAALRLELPSYLEEA